MKKLLIIVMDGIGVRTSRFGNAVQLAKTPNLNWLRDNALYTNLSAHGQAVGLPSDSDIGNSEVGHNTIGGGRIFRQGAKLIQDALKSGAIFTGKVWQDLVSQTKSKNGTLHLIGLLSDGNVHSHEGHLYALLKRAKEDGIKRVRIHALLDGRDVAEKSAEIYVDRLNVVIQQLQDSKFDVAIASGGGRMLVTMDRYEADWQIVERGWKAHVLGQSQHQFTSLEEAIAFFRRDAKLTDQYFPEFVICKNGKPVGTIEDGDGVVFFNFRGDRAIEISRAFCENEFKYFERQRFPKVYFAGMMQYDGDLKIPNNYLVSPPEISNTLGEYLCQLKVRQFACSETQKFGHVTFFWNGNRSGKFDQKLEEYVEIPSDKIAFDLKPEMKAKEIADATIERMRLGSFQCGRINFANGDMVGHTGNLLAAISAVETVDAEIGRIVEEAKNSNFMLLIIADHGNCDEMFDAKEEKHPQWELEMTNGKFPTPKTSHTLNPVPFYFFNPSSDIKFKLRNFSPKTLANIANTALCALDLPENAKYDPALIERY